MSEHFSLHTKLVRVHRTRAAVRRQGTLWQREIGLPCCQIDKTAICFSPALSKTQTCPSLSSWDEKLGESQGILFKKVFFEFKLSNIWSVK